MTASESLGIAFMLCIVALVIGIRVMWHWWDAGDLFGRPRP